MTEIENNPHQALIEEKEAEFTKATLLFKVGEGEIEKMARLQNLFVESLQATIDTVLEGAVAAAYENAIELSDKIELSADLPDGGVEQWKAFKRFRNTLRDTYLTPLTDKE